MERFLLLVVAFALLGQVRGGAQRNVREIHVAPTGDDSNPGTAAKPLATIEAAQQAARRLAARKEAAAIRVLIHQGTYFLSRPLVFTPEDTPNGLEVAYMAAEGERVVVSGGRRITGWRRGKGALWTAPVPRADWRFRNLWVNGRRATRARHPNPEAHPPCVQLQDARLAKDLSAYTLHFAPGVVKDWKNPGEIEVVIDGNWAINRKRVASLDPAAATVALAPPHRQTIPWNQPRRGRWSYLENSPSFLDQPGEWCRDGDTLLYWPLPGEDTATAEVIAPVLTRLVEVKGTKERPVRNLHFVGLTFAHTDWQLPPVGYFGVQACHFVKGTGKASLWTRIPCAIRFDYAEGCSVRNGAISHLGTGGIELVEGCRADLVEGNEISDISANGVMLGGPKDEARLPKACTVANNHVHHCGVEFMGAVGIWVGFAQDALVAHNRIHDLPYSGISLGWQWNPQPTPCKRNRLVANHIFEVMKHLGDGGGIYTLGFQPGTVIRGNHIHHVRRSPYVQAAPNNGMFIDEGSKGFLIENNVIYETSGQPVRHNQNQPAWHTWRSNHFHRGPLPTPTPNAIGEIIAAAGLQPPHRDRLLGQE